jgi:ABC-type uncharacterized transport system permease subunit
MTASDKLRNVVAGAIIAGTIVSLIIHPVSIQPLLIFAAIGIVAGVLSSLPGNIASWVSAVILVFGTERIQSALVARGVEVAWYAPMLIAVSFAIATYYLVRLLKRKTPTNAGV